MNEDRQIKCLSQVIIGTEVRENIIPKSVSDSNIGGNATKENDFNNRSVLQNGDRFCQNENTSIEKVRELFLENNIKDVEDREIMRREISNGLDGEEDIELRPQSTSGGRRSRTQTALVSEAFSFLQDNPVSALIEEDVDLVRIPPEGCESQRGVSMNPSSLTTDESLDDNQSENGSDVVNFSRNSMEIDGCESDTEDVISANSIQSSSPLSKDLNAESKTLNSTCAVSSDLSQNSSKSDATNEIAQSVSHKLTSSEIPANQNNSTKSANGVADGNSCVIANRDVCNSGKEELPCASVVRFKGKEGEVTHDVDLNNVIRRRPSGHKSKSSVKDEDLSDDSSDEDSGIYAESHRNSTWIQLDDEQMETTTMSDSEIEEKPAQPHSDKLLRLVSEDDTVFSEGTLSLPVVMGHKRSESTSTTLSETEFKRQRSYRSRRRCLIRRQESQQEYHRMSAKVYDQEKIVVIEKTDQDADFGLHILDSHPAFITSVDSGSAAERSGIQEGQIVISINGVNTLELSHDEIIQLIQKSENKVRVEVAYSDFTPVRDLQQTVMSGYMLKLGTSTLVKMWKKRYFILRQDNCLYYYKNEQVVDPLGAVPLSGYSISRYIDTTKDYCFKAEKYGAKTYYFMTDNRDEMSRWVGVLTEAAARCKTRKDSWLEVSSHNVGLPALEIRKPECTGSLTKLGQQHKTWQRRYCVLKDGCIYYYKSMSSLSAKGVVHLHGYKVDGTGYSNKKFSFVLHPPEAAMRTFYFYADNQTDKQRWVDCLIRSIQRWIRVDN